MKSFGNPAPGPAPGGRDNNGKSARSAEYTVAGALIGVCLIGGGAAWWLTRDSSESAPKPAPAVAAAPAIPATAPSPDSGANWHDQLQQEIGRIDREQQQEQSRADANEARLAELQKQRDDLERERQKLAAQAKAAPSPGAAGKSDTVASARPATATPAAPQVKHVPARILLNTCSAPRYPDASRQLNEEGRVIIGYQIDEYGKVVSSRIDTSSGSERLDSIAERALAKCKFKPGTANGVNETSWTQAAFTWKLN